MRIYGSWAVSESHGSLESILSTVTQSEGSLQPCDAGSDALYGTLIGITWMFIYPCLKSRILGIRSMMTETGVHLSVNSDALSRAICLQTIALGNPRHFFKRPCPLWSQEPLCSVLKLQR